jgi:exodeoxyribonuclease VII large subunit
MLRLDQMCVNYRLDKRQEKDVPNVPGTDEIFTVSSLNRTARQLLESGLPRVWVDGELSNLARPGSGHLYFSLKDASAQVRCAMFRSQSRTLNFQPSDGQQVLVHARVSIYEPRGSYQLIVDHMEEAGEGLLRQRFEALKAKLDKEGLFDEALKRPLPDLPRRIGVVTSPTGAAVRDILHILARRFPAIPVIVYPTAVQGDAAAAQIAAALDTASRRAECDVLILARGGGSLEDLWSFNEEVVARAIRASAVPVVSGVGHEIDFTIADFAADVRAPTPSGAAELVVPDAAEWLARITALNVRSGRAVNRLLQTRRQNLTSLDGRLARAHPGMQLRQMSQRTDELTQRLHTAVTTFITRRRLAASGLGRRLQIASPAVRMAHAAKHRQALSLRLLAAIRRQLDGERRRLAIAAAGLNGRSPLATLQRGYAIVTDKSGEVVRDAAMLAPGDKVTGRLAKGHFDASVISVRKNKS